MLFEKMNSQTTRVQNLLYSFILNSYISWIAQGLEEENHNIEMSYLHGCDTSKTWWKENGKFILHIPV